MGGNDILESGLKFEGLEYSVFSLFFVPSVRLVASSICSKCIGLTSVKDLLKLRVYNILSFIALKVVFSIFRFI